MAFQFRPVLKSGSWSPHTFFYEMIVSVSKLVCNKTEFFKDCSTSNAPDFFLIKPNET
jgi:hypothetical protein